MKPTIFSLSLVFLLFFFNSKSFANNTCSVNTTTASTCSIPSTPEKSSKEASSQSTNKSDQSTINNSSLSFMRHQEVIVPTDAPPILIEMFYSFDCPHCHEAMEWIPELKKTFPNVTVKMYEIKKIKANRELFEKTAVQHNITVTGVPTFFVGDKVFVGFYKNQTCCLLLDEIKALTFKNNVTKPPREIKVPILGTMRIDQISLLNFSIVIGLLDGLNPCAMWVLMFLLGYLFTLVHKKEF
ncbi:MAG: hypothetical protein HQK51_16600 [Oligoflexia bacterium]|nr:hypothetical protein [Oligoflexia bacterium]